MYRALVLGASVLAAFFVGLVSASLLSQGEPQIEASRPSALDSDRFLLDLQSDLDRQRDASKEIQAEIASLKTSLQSLEKQKSSKAAEEDFDRRIERIEDKLKRHPMDELVTMIKKDAASKAKAKISASEMEQQIHRRLAFARKAVEENGPDCPLLEDLVQLYLRSKDGKRAMDALKSYGELLPAWKRNRLYGKIFALDGNWDSLRQFLDKVKNDPDSPEWAKAEATLDFALSYFSEGKKSEGQLLLQGMIVQYGDDTPLGGLEFLEKAKAKLKDPNSTP